MARGRQIAPKTDGWIANVKPDRNAKVSAKHAVGGAPGLFLQVTPGGTKSWLLRVNVGGKRTEVGLGGYPEVSTADAREAAHQMRADLRRGIDPIAERKAAVRAAAADAARSITFAEATEGFLKVKLPTLKSKKEREGGYRSALDTYATPVLGKMQVADILTPDVVRVLSPIWAEKPEVARKLRMKIEGVLSWATANGFREGENPARLKGALEHALPKVKRQTTYQPALSLADASAFLSDLRRRDAMSAKALEFLLLTGARSGEVRGAVLSEFDLNARVWTVPASRMKMSRPHRFALSADAVALLRSLPRDGDLVFPAVRGGQLSDMSLSKYLKDMSAARPGGYLDPTSRRVATPHGLRSTFRTWAAETAQDRDMSEMQLAHDVAKDVERSYQRSDMFERRVKMMDRWAAFLRGETGQVFDLAANTKSR
jgi:integrase